MSAFEKHCHSHQTLSQGVRVVIPELPEPGSDESTAFLIIRQAGDLLEDIVHAIQVCIEYGLEEVALPKTPIWARAIPVIEGRLSVTKNGEFWFHGRVEGTSRRIQSEIRSLDELLSALSGSPAPGQFRFVVASDKRQDMACELDKRIDSTRKAFPHEDLTVDQVIEKWA